MAGVDRMSVGWSDTVRTIMAGLERNVPERPVVVGFGVVRQVRQGGERCGVERAGLAGEEM